MRLKEKMLVSIIFSFLRNVLKRFLYPGLQPFPKQQMLDSSKLEEFADKNFKFDENDRKISKWIENTVGKGQIANYKQFLLFLKSFQKTCIANM